MRLSLTLLAVVFSLTSFAQRSKEMTFTKTDNTSITTNGIVVFDNDLGVKINTDKGVINSAQLKNVRLKDKLYVPKEINGKTFLVEELITGTLSLYRGKKYYYLDNDEHGFRKIPELENTSTTTFKSGTVSVYINTCNSAVQLLSKYAESLTLSKLEDLIKNYNSCDLQEDVQLSEKNLAESMQPDEKVEFGLSLGFMHMNTDYSQLTPSPSTNIAMGSFGAIVYFHSNLFNNNLDVNFSVDYFTSTDQTIAGESDNIYSETKLINTLVGFNYVFNNLNDMFKPYLGVSGGVLFHSGSSIILDPQDSGDPTSSFDGLNMLTYNINVGTVIHAFNQKFDFLIAYQPGLEMRVVSNSELFDSYETYYDSSALNLRLTYVF